MKNLNEGERRENKNKIKIIKPRRTAVNKQKETVNYYKDKILAVIFIRVTEHNPQLRARDKNKDRKVKGNTICNTK